MIYQTLNGLAMNAFILFVDHNVLTNYLFA